MKPASILPRVMLLAVAVSGVAVEQPASWKPHAHPASIERAITGFTRPRHTVVVAAEVPGRVTVVALDVGQPVGAAQAAALVSIDDAQALIARDQAQAALLAAEQAASAAALAQQAAEAEAALRARTAARTKNLAEQGKLSAEEADTTLTAADLARLAAERAKVNTTQAATAVTQARLDLARAADHLVRHRVPAPIGWLVSARLVEPGTMVAAGTPLLRVVDTATLVIDLPLSVEEFAALRASSMLQVRFPRHAGHTARAILARFDPDFDPVTRKRRVELEVVGSEAPEAIGGLEAVVTATMPDPSGALLVPLGYVGTASPRVRLSGGGDVPVTVVRRDREYAVILPGTLPADAVLVP